MRWPRRTSAAAGPPCGVAPRTAAPARRDPVHKTVAVGDPYFQSLCGPNLCVLRPVVVLADQATTMMVALIYFRVVPETFDDRRDVRPTAPLCPVHPVLMVADQTRPLAGDDESTSAGEKGFQKPVEPSAWRGRPATLAGAAVALDDLRTWPATPGNEREPAVWRQWLFAVVGRRTGMVLSPIAVRRRLQRLRFHERIRPGAAAPRGVRRPFREGGPSTRRVRADGRVRIVPAARWPRDKPGPLIGCRAVGERVPTSAQESWPERAWRRRALQVRRRMRLQPADEFEQRWQIDGRLQAAGHLATEIGIDHPRGNGLPDIGTAEIQVLHTPTAELTHDGEVMLAEEGVERVPNGNLALVTGIITCRLQRAKRAMPAAPDTLKRELQRG